jgi:hypothetical protein
MTLADYEKYIKSNLQQPPQNITGATGYNNWKPGHRGMTGPMGATGPIVTPGIDYTNKNKELILKEAMQMFDISDEQLRKEPFAILAKIREYKINQITE